MADKGESGRIRILVADDDDSFRQALVRYLETQGIACVQAASGSEACAAARDEAFDVALVDCWMPVMSGFETMQGLMEIDPFLPVVLISAMGTEATAREAVRQGAADFLSKSMSPREIESGILRKAQQTRSRRSQDEAIGGKDPKDPRGTILLVDDHERFRRAAARILRRAGYRVREAACGGAAVDLCRQEPLDGAIIDLHLPDSSGIEVARVIRAVRSHVPVVLISGEANREDRRESLNHGITGCLNKAENIVRLGAVAQVLVEDARRSRRKEALLSAPPEAWSIRLSKTLRASVRRGRQWSRRTEARVYVAGLAMAALIAVTFMGALARYEERQFEPGRKAREEMSVFEMYDRIAGYLERDERRELEREERR